jgi:hypothetical protein
MTITLGHFLILKVYLVICEIFDSGHRFDPVFEILQTYSREFSFERGFSDRAV